MQAPRPQQTPHPVMPIHPPYPVMPIPPPYPVMPSDALLEVFGELRLNAWRSCWGLLFVRCAKPTTCAAVWAGV